MENVTKLSKQKIKLVSGMIMLRNESPNGQNVSLISKLHRIYYFGWCLYSKEVYLLTETEIQHFQQSKVGKILNYNSAAGQNHV